MRLWARPRVRISLVNGFSMAITSVPNTPTNKALCLLIHPIARQSDFRVPTNLKEKTTLFGASNCITICNHVTIQYPRPGWRILTPRPVKQQQLIVDAKTILGSANPCPNAVHMEPFSTSVFNVAI